MGSFLTILKVVLSLVPVIIEAVKAIEKAIPGSGQGDTKLDAIKQIIASVDDKAAEFWPYIEKVIGVLVSLFNQTGVFQTTDPDPATQDA